MQATGSLLRTSSSRTASTRSFQRTRPSRWIRPFPGESTICRRVVWSRGRDIREDDPSPEANSLVPTASAIVVDDEGRVLLQWRTDNGRRASPGGRMELGEGIGDCAVRTFRSDVKRLRPTSCGAGRVPDRSPFCGPWSAQPEGWGRHGPAPCAATQ
ncbi:NUDIX domain-containing protein [Streptomyces sp. NPDC054932]